MASPYDNLRFSQSQIIPQYASAPIEEFGKLLEKREGDYQKNIADFDQLELAASTLKVNDADYKVKKAALEEVRRTIKGIADSGGAYEFSGSKMRSAAQGFMGNAALKAAMENEATIKSKRDEYQQLYLSGKMSKEGKEEADRRLNAYSGVGEGENGLYNTPELYAPIKYTDYNTKLNSFGQNFKASMESSGWKQELGADGVPTGWMEKITVKGIERTSIEDAMRDYAESDSDIMATINEIQTLTGEDVLTKSINAQAEKLGYKIIDRDIKADAPYLAKVKRANDNALQSSFNFDIITRLPGAEIKSLEKYKEKIQSIDKINDELLNKRNNLSVNPYENEVEIAKINQQMEALAGQKEANETIFNNYENKAYKELGINPTTYLEENTIPKEEFKKQKIIDSSPSIQEYYFTKKGQEELEKEYKEYLSIEAPIAAKVNQYYEEAGEDKTIMGTGRVLATEAERKTAGAIFDSTFGLGNLYKGKTLENKAADVLLMGATFIGTDKGGKQVDDDTIKEVNSRGEVNYYTDPLTNREGLITDLLDKDGRSLGKVFISTPSLQASILRTNPDKIGYLAGGQITAITTSLEGSGEVSLPASGAYPALSTNVKYLGNDLEAAKEGYYRLTYITPKGEEVSKPFPNNIAVMEAIKNLYLSQKTQ